MFAGAFNQFFEIGESFNVDVTEQKQDSYTILNHIEDTFKNM